MKYPIRVALTPEGHIEAVHGFVFASGTQHRVVIDRRTGKLLKSTGFNSSRPKLTDLERRLIKAAREHMAGATRDECQ